MKLELPLDVQALAGGTFCRLWQLRNLHEDGTRRAGKPGAYASMIHG